MRSGRPRRAVPAGGWALSLVVFLLSAGVIAMHSLGATHHPPITSAMASAPTHSTHSTSAPKPTQVVPWWVSGSAPSPEYAAASGCAVCAAVTGAAVTGAAVSGHLISAVDGAGMSGHGLLAMCLAVLPFLALVLRRTWRGWLRVSQLWVPRSPAVGGGPRWRAGGEVSLTRLCILRT